MTPTTNREPSAEQARPEVSSDLAPLYAVAGLTEVVTERLRTAATESREQVARKVAELSGRSLPDLVRAVPGFAVGQLSRIGAYADVRRARAGAVYAELAVRGKAGVDGALSQAAGTIDPVLERVQQGVGRLRHNAAGRNAAGPDTTGPDPTDTDPEDQLR